MFVTINRCTVPGTFQGFITFIISVTIILPLFCPQHHLLQVLVARKRTAASAFPSPTTHGKDNHCPVSWRLPSKCLYVCSHN